MTTNCSELDFTHSFSNTSHLFSYDLCPLFSHHPSFKHEFSKDTLPTRTNYIYEIALGRGIKKDGTLPAELQCPNNSLICMKAINTRPNHPSEPARIIQVIPVALGGDHTRKPSIRHIANTTEEEPHLQLTIHGSEYMGIQQKAVFHIFCDEARSESSIPKLEHLYRWKGSHVFNWTSEHGCPKITAHDGEDKTPESHDEENEAPRPPTDEEEQENLTTKPPPTSPLRPLTLLSLCILFIIIAFAFRITLLKRYKTYLRQLMPKLSFSKRRRYQSRAREYDFLLEDIASEGSYRKYTV